MNRCEIVKDLLPLYVEKVCSKESEKYVCEHLDECASCRDLYETMKVPQTSAEDKKAAETELARIEPLARIKRNNRKKAAAAKIIIVLLLGIICSFIGILIHRSLSHYEGKAEFESAYCAMDRAVEIVCKKYGANIGDLFVDVVDEKGVSNRLYVVSERNLNVVLIDHAEGEKYDIVIGRQQDGHMKIVIDKEKTEQKGEIDYFTFEEYVKKENVNGDSFLVLGNVSENILSGKGEVCLYIPGQGEVPICDADVKTVSNTPCIYSYLRDDKTGESVTRVEISENGQSSEKVGYRIKCVIFNLRNSDTD